MKTRNIRHKNWALIATLAQTMGATAAPPIKTPPPSNIHDAFQRVDSSFVTQAWSILDSKWINFASDGDCGWYDLVGIRGPLYAKPGIVLHYQIILNTPYHGRRAPVYVWEKTDSALKMMSMECYVDSKIEVAFKVWLSPGLSMVVKPDDATRICEMNDVIAIPFSVKLNSPEPQSIQVLGNGYDGRDLVLVDREKYRINVDGYQPGVVETEDELKKSARLWTPEEINEFNNNARSRRELPKLGPDEYFGDVSGNPVTW